MNINKLYNNRFNKKQRQGKDALWKVLCHSFFQQYISKDACLPDVGAGFCEFVNNIICKDKYAIDLNKNISLYANPDVHIINEDSRNLGKVPAQMFDIVFMSNFLEHLKSKEEVLQVLSEVYRILKNNVRVLVLQPNIRYIYKEYWDFFDHHVPLSDRGLVEALGIAGFSIEYKLSKFLPFTTKSKFPKHPFFVKAYLAVPLIWKIFGKQAFVIGKKNA